jgi:16S rRNA (cytidine1402-2'-O)-methyltransferase
VAVTGRLVVCPTPIGNLEDVTLRVLSALRDADVIACEDTRRTRVLLDRYGAGGELVTYHEHNEDRRAGELVERMRAGATVALVSDAGMPLVSDPGYVLVRACVAAGVAVEVLPGPSAALAALVASALPADRWRFAGFLPRKRGELRDALAEPGGTLVAFESPHRLAATLATLADIDPERPAAVCRELTKVHEEVARGTARDLAERFGQRAPKGEVVLVVGGSRRGTGRKDLRPSVADSPPALGRGEDPLRPSSTDPLSLHTLHALTQAGLDTTAGAIEAEDPRGLSDQLVGLRARCRLKQSG